MPILAGPPTIIRPPDPADSEGAAWWVYALIGLFFASGVGLLIVLLVSFFI